MLLPILASREKIQCIQHPVWLISKHFHLVLSLLTIVSKSWQSTAIGFMRWSLPNVLSESRLKSISPGHPLRCCKRLKRNPNPSLTQSLKLTTVMVIEAQSSQWVVVVVRSTSLRATMIIMSNRVTEARCQISLGDIWMRRATTISSWWLRDRTMRSFIRQRPRH